MSGMDSNPFGEPDSSNPFADPAVTQVTTQSQRAQPVLEDYNPFENQQNRPSNVRGAVNPPQFQTSPRQDLTNQPAVMQPVAEPPPAYTPTRDQSINSAELQRRQEELERKAAELQAREEALRNVNYNARTNNWPPIPQKCCGGPCFYQDISVDIPLEFQRIVKTMYYIWMFYVCLLFLNMLGALALLIVNKDGTTFGFSILAFVLFTPMSFVCWFRPLYKAFRSDSSFNFMVFFFVFFFQFILAVIYAIGVPYFGSCGLLNGIMTIQHTSNNKVSNYTVGIIAITIGLFWAVAALMSFVMLIKIHRMYRTTGASFSKAQEEFATGVLRHENVQNAAASAARQAVNQNLAGNRY